MADLTLIQLRALRVAHEALELDKHSTESDAHRAATLRAALERIAGAFPEDDLYRGQS